MWSSGKIHVATPKYFPVLAKRLDSLIVQDWIWAITWLYKPFRRALSYQAYTAYFKSVYVSTNAEPVEYGSENYSERQLMQDAVFRDMKEELGVMEEGTEDESA